MFRENISEKYLVQMSGTSEGSQRKYFKDGYWYKEDHSGCEGLAEYLVSRLLTFSDLPESDYVLYEQGFINDKAGCRSRDFLQDGDELLTLYRLYYNEFGQDLSAVINKMNDVQMRIEYTLKFVRECCGIDITEYLARVITLDRITLNEDRHLNNLAVIFNGEGYRPAPIFDNGVSLLTANRSVNWHFPIEENVKRVVARPFSGSFDAMYQCLGNAITFRVKDALEWLSTEPQSTEKDVLQYQLMTKAVGV